MSNIDKLKSAATKAVDNFDPNMFVETRDVLALLDELEAKDLRVSDLERELVAMEAVAQALRDEMRAAAGKGE